MAIDKLRPSFTFTEDRLVELRAVVPEAFADGAVNWEALRDALGAHLEDEGRDAEHFGLTWPGKRQARRLAAQPSKGTLRPATGEGVDEGTTRNLFIEGDNLEVLKLLQKSYAGRVKLIFIDPPYNTGQDFIYRDDYSDSLADYLKMTGQLDDANVLLSTNTSSSGRYHSNWLSMIYPRLVLARQLLRDDGLIFVSIDDHEVHHLRTLMNEIFGEENFIAGIVWQKTYSPANDKIGIDAMHDTILCYQRSLGARVSLLPRTAKQDDAYTNPDNDPRGPWKAVDSTRAEHRDYAYFPITTPSGKVVYPANGRSWVFTKEELPRLLAEKRLWFGKDGASKPSKKLFLSEVKQGVVPTTWWGHEDAGHNDEAKKELKALMSEGIPFDTPKPTRLLRRVLQIGTTLDGEDIVLDFFAGSGTTAHAVLVQNREDNGNRRFIMVQLPNEITSKGTANISDISKERIRRVINRLKQEAKGKLDFRKGAASEDLGFRVYKLGRSNYKAWQDYQGDSVEELETLFDRIETPLVDGWKREDVLSEVLLLQGFPLDSAVVDEAGFKQNRIQRVESDAIGHRLFVCLDDQIVDATIERLQIASEDVFVCLDSALTDEAKLRLGDRCTLRVI